MQIRLSAGGGHGKRLIVETNLPRQGPDCHDHQREGAHLPKQSLTVLRRWSAANAGRTSAVGSAELELTTQGCHSPSQPQGGQAGIHVCRWPAVGAPLEREAALRHYCESTWIRLPMSFDSPTLRALSSRSRVTDFAAPMNSLGESSSLTRSVVFVLPTQLRFSSKRKAM